MNTEYHEKQFANFVRIDKKGRFNNFIASKSGRNKLLNEMNTLSKYINADKILAELDYADKKIAIETLQKKNSPEVVYVFSDEIEYDQKTLPLDAAVNIAFETSFVTIVSCIPGKLALVVSNESSERYVLYSN